MKALIEIKVLGIQQILRTVSSDEERRIQRKVDIITGRQYTYAELRDSSAALAVRLQTKFKLNRGDVVAICLPNLPEYPGATLGAIEAGLTVTTVNPIYTADFAQLKTYDISPNDLAVCPLVGHYRFAERFPKAKFLQRFRMTECSPVALMTPVGNTRYSSTSFYAVILKGPQVMLGYLNNEEANKETLYPGGWLRTGDVAITMMRAISISQTIMKELIKVKGFQVPAELEQF
ncbi:4-coumarate--CoA ligase-like 5 [Eumeta japonica]|uniref:4-coumarate--CoA ligase-like 5 n=1 Tax=Eumeta variegata TaxID=151549 RepID=A0A4C1TJH8_EUMVA|nr:4-coumarate--CoA ligase-like 5 [Eumeta japonica]